MKSHRPLQRPRGLHNTQTRTRTNAETGRSDAWGRPLVLPIRVSDRGQAAQRIIGEVLVVAVGSGARAQVRDREDLARGIVRAVNQGLVVLPRRVAPTTGVATQVGRPQALEPQILGGTGEVREILHVVALVNAGGVAIEVEVDGGHVGSQQRTLLGPHV